MRNYKTVNTMKKLLCLLFISSFQFIYAQSVSKADEKAVLSRLRQMENLFRNQNLLGIAQIYLDNGYLISPNESTTGREQINRYWTSIKNPIDWKLTSFLITDNEKSLFESDVYKSLPNKPPGWEKLNLDLKDTLYQIGRSELKSLWNGKESLSVVNFILIWKKQPDGTFKILADTYAGL